MSGPRKEWCFAPGDSGLSSDTSSLFGQIAEKEIALEYLLHRKRTLYFPLSSTDFMDTTSGFANMTLYQSFLLMKNAGRVSPSRLQELRRRFQQDGLRRKKKSDEKEDGFIKIPDLLTDDGNNLSYYEIKPNSATGLSAGADKIAKLQAFYDYFGFPYKPGTLWTPDKRRQLGEFTIDTASVHIKLFFHFKRIAPGLIVYELCIEASLEVEEALAKAIIAALVLAIVFGPELLAAAGAAVEGAEVLALARMIVPLLRGLAPLPAL